VVTSPDQHKPGNLKAARIAGVATAAFLILMIFSNHRHHSHVENVWLIVLAGGLVLIFVVDAVLRRNGLRR
jgi:hypothetical protein